MPSVAGNMWGGREHRPPRLSSTRTSAICLIHQAACVVALSAVVVCGRASAQEKRPPQKRAQKSQTHAHRSAPPGPPVRRSASPVQGRAASPPPGVVSGPAPLVSISKPTRVSDKAIARKLLQSMMRPLLPFTGVQETISYSNGGTVTEQTIEGERNGSVRIQLRSPERIAGDVMIITANNFYSYYRAKNLLEVAYWPTEWNDKPRQMFASLANGSMTARLNGSEMVAGRLASIVTLSGAAAPGSRVRIRRKFWIDDQTGILLKIEESNEQGQIMSTTTMTSIVVNPPSPINPADFKPLFTGAVITPLFPDMQYRSMQEAQGHLPFQPLEFSQAAMPANFQLDGVWGFGDFRAHPYQCSVLMRFSDGVSSFCLYERMVAPAKEKLIEAPKRQSFKKPQQNWRIALPQGGEMNVQYIGHLTGDQVEAIYNSIH